ncbi:MAG: hypothetical protein OEZ68_01140 [Gammaproteobacteria bacterium]|nr:hypothetical protein [Gammaproteobacteria bacterium]MDH5799384.1 hypothetical protein [Gammaproteobacteria bacterium]
MKQYLLVAGGYAAMIRSRLMVLLFSLLVAGSAFAEACSYREAMIAYENGNKVRGDALMRMAANDGDVRAQTFLHNTRLAQIEPETKPQPLLANSSQSDLNR